MVSWGRRNKSNTKFHTIAGKAVYVKPYVPDEYNGVENWKCGLTVTKDSFNELKSWGCQLQKRLAEDVPNIDENTPYVTFKRNVMKEFKDNTVYFCPPVIYDKDGNELISYVNSEGKTVRQFNEGEEQPTRKGEPILIGNGSDIEVTIGIYPAGQFGYGTRLESIKIIDLIEFTPEDDEKDSQSEKKSEERQERKKSVDSEGNTKSDIGW